MFMLEARRNMCVETIFYLRHNKVKDMSCYMICCGSLGATLILQQVDLSGVAHDYVRIIARPNPERAVHKCVPKRPGSVNERETI